MRVTQFESGGEEAVAVRLFLWVGLLSTLSCAGLAAYAVVSPALF